MKPLNILFVDDEPIRAQSLVDLGHNVFLCHGIDQLLFYKRLIDRTFFDVICLDHDMPLLNGMEVIKQIKNYYCPRIVIHTTNEVAMESMFNELKECGHEVHAVSITHESWIHWVVEGHNRTWLEQLPRSWSNHKLLYKN